MDLYTIIDIIIGAVIALLIGIQCFLSYLSPFKKDKWTFTKKVLDELDKKAKDDSVSKQDKDTNITDNN